jgi:hypothetical protein
VIGEQESIRSPWNIPFADDSCVVQQTKINTAQSNG